jgi:hypothetical protein
MNFKAFLFCVQNFKAFFRWLYVVILRLSKEEVPAELGRINQHQLDFVADFLKENFSHFDPDALQEPERQNGDSENPINMSSLTSGLTPGGSDSRFQSPSRTKISRFENIHWSLHAFVFLFDY